MKDFFRRIKGRFTKRAKIKVMESKQKIDAQKLLAMSPVRDYLMALMDELVRQGLYLSQEDQIGARFTVELLTKQIEKGDIILKKEEKINRK